jgi:hypothetical protein
MHTDRYEETHEALATGEGMRERPEPDSRAPADPEEDVVVQA